MRQAKVGIVGNLVGHVDHPSTIQESKCNLPLGTFQVLDGGGF